MKKAILIGILILMLSGCQSNHIDPVERIQEKYDHCKFELSACSSSNAECRLKWEFEGFHYSDLYLKANENCVLIISSEKPKHESYPNVLEVRTLDLERDQIEFGVDRTGDFNSETYWLACE